jgi:imidazolonepropionase-like amidohydrolase
VCFDNNRIYIICLPDLQAKPRAESKTMPARWLLIEGADVIDGRGAGPAPKTNVLVRGNRIAAVGAGAERSKVPRGEDLRVIDAAGRTLMPGLIDSHCHMTYGECLSNEEIEVYTGVETRTLVAAWNLNKVLRAGVTSISQPGGTYNIGVALRDGIDNGTVPGPRMTTAGRYIATSNSLTGGEYPEAIGNPASMLGVVANSLPEMLGQVRRQIRDGVDFIKLADSPYGQWQAFTNDEMKAISDLVHQLNRKLTIHARGSAEVNAAIDAGMDWIMHGNAMTDEVIEKLAASRITLVPTLLLLANIADFGKHFGSPPGLRDGCRRMLEATGETLHKAHAAGVVFSAGTDTGFGIIPYGEWHARELDLLVTYAGLSPLEAIEAGTRNGAKMMGLAGEVGEISVGALADLIVVRGDPSKQVTVLMDKRNIETVIKDGEVVSFPGHLDEARRNHERMRVYTTSVVTYESVFGEGDPVPPELIPWPADQQRQLLSELGQRTGASIVAQD